jgi:hypothetical protein
VRTFMCLPNIAPGIQGTAGVSLQLLDRWTHGGRA